jgi:hypothetical protein
LELTKTDDSTNPVRINFPEIMMRPMPVSGVTLDSVNIPIGSYSSIVLYLEGRCNNGLSLAIDNSQGAFETSEVVRLRFDSSIIVTDTTRNLLFTIQSFATSLAGYSFGSGATLTLAETAEATTGSFSESTCMSTYVAEVLQDQPKSYWRMNDLVYLAEDIGTAKNPAVLDFGGILREAPAFPGFENFSIRWTGAIRALTSVVPFEYFGTDTLTIEFWAKGTDQSKIGVFDNYTNEGFGLGTGVCPADQFEVKFGPGAVASFCLTGFVRDFNWHHWVMTSDASGIIIYRDGSVIPTTNPGPTTFGACLGNCAIGFGQMNSATVDPVWQQDVAIYGSSLSAADVLRHYNASKSCQ